MTMNIEIEKTNCWVKPLAAEGYHGLAGYITKTIAPYTEADPVAILLQLLVAFGNLIGRSAYYMVESTRHYAVLFAVIVGQTAKARKGTSWGHVERLLTAVDPEWAKHCLMQASPTGEGIIWALRDPVYILRDRVRELVDAGVDDKRLMLALGEYVSVLTQCRRPASSLSGVLRNAWDGGPLASLTKNHPSKATGAHLSIAAHIVMDELKRSLKPVDISNGLANRTLFCCARRSQLLPDGGQPPEDEMRLLSEQLREAAAWAKKIGRVTRDRDADVLWRDVYPDLSRDRDGVVGAICARAEAQVTRLAMINALIDKSEVIRVSHLQAALALWNYCEESAQFVFCDLGQKRSDADVLFLALQQHPEGLDRTQIHGLFSRNRKASEINDALFQLMADEKVQRKTVPSAGGRPSDVFVAVQAAS